MQSLAPGLQNPAPSPGTFQRPLESADSLFWVMEVLSPFLIRFSRENVLSPSQFDTGRVRKRVSHIYEPHR